MVMVTANGVKRLAVAAAAAVLTVAGPVAAATITFDDAPATADGSIANGYAGLDWTNMFVVAPLTDAPVSGYQAAITSGQNVAYNGFDAPATIGGLAGMVLLGGNFTAAFNNGLTITAQGYDGNALIHQLSFVVDTTGPTRQDFNWSGITRVVFSSAGGTDQFFAMSGTSFALDDLGVSAVPEPAGWLAMMLGLSVVGGAMRVRTRRGMRATA